MNFRPGAIATPGVPASIEVHNAVAAADPRYPDILIAREIGALILARDEHGYVSERFVDTVAGPVKVGEDYDCVFVSGHGVGGVRCAVALEHRGGE